VSPLPHLRTETDPVSENPVILRCNCVLKFGPLPTNVDELLVEICILLNRIDFFLGMIMQRSALICGKETSHTDVRNYITFEVSFLLKCKNLAEIFFQLNF
jgi:hypothetical protein